MSKIIDFDIFFDTSITNEFDLSLLKKGTYHVYINNINFTTATNLPLLIYFDNLLIYKLGNTKYNFSLVSDQNNNYTNYNDLYIGEISTNYNIKQAKIIVYDFSENIINARGFMKFKFVLIK